MKIDFLKKLKEKNEFPIIFIGSGITQRYFSDAPTWDKLLEQIWKEAKIDESYFAKFEQLKNEYDSTFLIYTKLADELEQKYNQSFLQGNSKIDNFTPEIAHKENISPFRKLIASIFLNLKAKSGMKEEIEAFFSMLKKARMIITTNYDLFIEENLKNINVRIGNKGLFEPSNMLNELYKIHGSVNDVNSIVITSKDYNKLERTSAIVDAKILSQLTISPIIFLGYSLTDQNIQMLLKDLANNMPFPINEAAERIGVVDYQSGNQEINESITCTSDNVYYTKLATDNFKYIYESIAKVNQGISPFEINKYQDAFRQIIDEKGREGELEQVLTSFVDLDKLPKELKSKNIVVAFGDNRFIYKYPTYVDYVKDYFLNKENMPIEIAIRFILKTAPNSTLPVSKYVAKVVKENFALNDEDKKRLNNRLSNFSELESLRIQSVPKKYKKYLEKLDFSNARKVLKKSKVVKNTIKLNYFSLNIDKYPKKEASELIKYILENEKDEFISTTTCRKLFMAYSLCYENKIEAIK